MANETECSKTTTSTTTTTLEKTPATTTTETTSTTSTTTTTTTTSTTTTICDDSLRGYLLINDQDDRCYRGYKFRFSENKWNCTTGHLGCRIDVIVTTPLGATTTVTARQNVYTGITLDFNGMVGNIFCTHEEKIDTNTTEFTGVIKFQQ